MKERENKSKPLIGIAGKSGSGKNFIANILEYYGWRSLDLDVVAHRILETIPNRIARVFGSSVLNHQGMIDRQALGDLVFQDPEKLDLLEKITYPLIEKAVEEWLAEKPESPAVIHGVNLHKTVFPEQCDMIIWVKAPQWLRRKRICSREHCSWKDIKPRFTSQKELNSKLLSSRAETFIVRNVGNSLKLEVRLGKILVHLPEFRRGENI